MLKYYKDFFSDYQYAEVIQTLILLVFILFFVTLFYKVWNKPKGYYKDLESSALEEDDKEENKK